MKYLITGAAGFIGSHLVDTLLKRGADITILDGHGDQITVIDDLTEGKWSNLPNDPRLKVYEGSILGDCGILFEGIDVVFHLAALTRPQWSIVHPEETTHINVDGTVRILQHCKTYGVKRLVFVSSSSIYGEQTVFPTPETATPNPMSPYALSKLQGEEYCKMFERLYGIQANFIRPFNVYGTRQRPDNFYAAAVPKFIDLIRKGKTPQITGDGSQARDYIYVDDVVDLMIKASESKVFGEAFNAGSGKNISINDLCAQIADLMDSKILPEHIAPVIEPGKTLADISKAKKLLDWEPKVSLIEGLRRTINA